MKKCFLILFLFFIGVVFGQTIDHIQFDYDAPDRSDMNKFSRER